MPAALELYRSLPRYLLSRGLSASAPASSAAFAGALAPLRLVHGDRPKPISPEWARVRPRLSGICGSDLGTISGATSLYFSALVSMPFVPGHEVVGELLDDVGDLRRGERVVLDPPLSCRTRAIDLACRPCREDEDALCERVTSGHLSPGLQTGYCRDTGGGWSDGFTAHRHQLHRVPERMSDEDAVLVEPLACAIRAVERAAVPESATVLIVGAGTVGILTLTALRALARPKAVIVVAKHGPQAEEARRRGATTVVSPSEALGALRRSTGAFRLDPEMSAPYLLGGADVAFECAGSAAALDLALRAVRARGRVVLSAMPAAADLSPAWFRELEIRGSYSGGGAFPRALELAAEASAGTLLSATYPLPRWREAIDHALAAGSLGAFKIAFQQGSSSK